jgi:hypothetical protein
MTDIWDTESAEYVDDEAAEWDDDGEDVEFGDSDMFGEAGNAAQKRREAQVRARRRALEIQRRAVAARRRVPARPVTTTTAIRNTRAAVRREHLANQVRSDSFGGAVGGLRRRTTGLERTVSAAAVTNTIKNELDTFTDRGDLDEGVTNILKTLVDFVPLVFVKSDVKGYRNPPVVAAAAAGAVALTGLLIRSIQNRNDNGGGGVDLAAPRPGQPQK